MIAVGLPLETGFMLGLLLNALLDSKVEGSLRVPLDCLSCRKRAGLISATLDLEGMTRTVLPSVSGWRNVHTATGCPPERLVFGVYVYHSSL